MHNMNTVLNVSEAALMLRKSVKTLQRWDREGTLKSRRSPSGRRMYMKSDLLNFLGVPQQAEDRRSVAYCRVSSHAQRPDLKNQKTALAEFCTARGIANVEIIEEVGGGLNFKRKKFLSLVDDIVSGKISCLILAHKDRLARFGFDLLSHLCRQADCQLLVISDERMSPEQEMVQDLMTIVHCFSSRLYGLRNYRKSLKAALNQ